MISVTHFDSSAPGFGERARIALEVLARQRGYVRGTVGRSTDDAARWVFVTEWSSVGAYRRALGAYDVKMHAWPLFYEAIDQPTSFESLVVAAPGSAAEVRRSDLAEPG